MRSQNLSATCVIRKRKALVGRESRYIIPCSITYTDTKKFKHNCKSNSCKPECVFYSQHNSWYATEYVYNVVKWVRERETDRTYQKKKNSVSYAYWTVRHCDSWRIRDQLDVIMFYFTSSMLNMFRTWIHPSSGACDFSIVSPHWSCVLVLLCAGVSVWLSWAGIRVAGWSTLQPATQIPPQPSHTETPTHIERRTYNQCGDAIEKSQAPDDGCSNVRNMLSIEDVK